MESWSNPLYSTLIKLTTILEVECEKPSDKKPLLSAAQESNNQA